MPETVSNHRSIRHRTACPRPCVLLILCLGCLCMGCDSDLSRHDNNEVYAVTVAISRGVQTVAARQDVDTVVDKLFGSPEFPNWPDELLDSSAAKSLVSSNSLLAAAGRVSSDKDGKNFGLFNKHCVQCHGLNGSGSGPASRLQNPYPRDFRPGIFKWKSTDRRAKPTREDLAKVIRHGVAGTGMPSFALLPKDEINSLVDYVIFLSVRGETERALLAWSVDELGYDDEAMQGVDRIAVDSQETTRLLGEIAQSWVDAKSRVVPIAEETDNNADSIERGKNLFHGQIANCVGCHGPSGNGAAVMLDFDDWTKEYSSRLGLTPTDREAMKPLRKAGAHRPRQIQPRKLTDGVFRGGSDSATLFRRISQGIAGTPMPSVKITDEESTTGLSTQQAWDLVHYVQSLSKNIKQ